MDKHRMMDVSSSKSHSILPGGGGIPSSLQNSIPTTIPGQQMPSLHGNKTYDMESMELMSQIQEMLNQLLNRGFNSMMVTVGPLGDIGVHGSLKGLNFLKDNPDIGERFSKICTDDVWSLIGAQKRFLELGRSGQNKSSNFNDKSDFPLDFSHERGSFFQNSENRNSQDNGFGPSLLNQTAHQNKGYQPNFLSGNFNQYLGEQRHTYPNVPFFQGGFSQGGSSSESFPQSSFMSTIDASSLSNNTIDQGPSTSNNDATPPPPQQQLSTDKTSLTQSEADIIKEMLSSSQIHDVFKDPSSLKSSPKEKQKLKQDKDSMSGKKEDSSKKKRERRPDTWQRNIKKKLKIEGKAYYNAKGKLIPEKKMLPVDCSKCKQRCSDKISEETRQKIFEWFWKLGSYTAQKEFVVSRVTQVQTKTSKRRHVHRLFSFEINGNYVSVCKPFFSKTLGVGDSYIMKAFEQKARDLFVQDGRGKHAPVNKTSAEQIDDVHFHLDCYLSGYSTERPLPKNVHAVKWYDEYVAYCQERDHKPVSKHIYRKIFQEYTLKFPKSPEKKGTHKPTQPLRFNPTHNIQSMMSR